MKKIDFRRISYQPIFVVVQNLTTNFIQKNMDKCQARCVYKIWNIK